MIIGYTAGVYDMFHVGHLNLLKNAKKYCDHLIVGVNSDELTFLYKDKYPVIPLSERMSIVGAIRYVDEVIRADDIIQIDESGVLTISPDINPDLIIIGDDHKNDIRWKEVDMYFRRKGSRVVFLPYTNHISSTKLTDRYEQKIKD